MACIVLAQPVAFGTDGINADFDRFFGQGRSFFGFIIMASAAALNGHFGHGLSHIVEELGIDVGQGLIDGRYGTGDAGMALCQFPAIGL